METAPTIVGRELKVVDLPIEENQGFYRMRLPNGVETEGTSAHCLAYLHGLVRWDLLQSHAGSPLVHAAALTFNGKRLIVVGSKGAGKSTLAAHLLFQGHPVEGDENVVVEDNGPVAVPRTLRVKPSSFKLLRDRSRIEQCPSFTDQDGNTVYSVSPASISGSWTIAPDRFDAVVFAEANHGAQSLSRPLTADESYRRMIEHSFYTNRNIAAMAARIRALATTMPSFVLRLGSLDSAETHLRMIVEG